ncbi:MAG TPA: hypothetical protein VMF03_15265 [Steroidobacteraceae bacterium]|nr:hypothetical protein [Steroidobacteraceae bacterium]
MVPSEFIPAPPDPAPPPLPHDGRDHKGIQRDIADADKAARTGSTDEKVRDTPPAGAWNDTTHD